MRAIVEAGFAPASIVASIVRTLPMPSSRLTPPVYWQAFTIGLQR
jgi:hypothetical protein